MRRRCRSSRPRSSRPSTSASISAARFAPTRSPRRCSATPTSLRPTRRFSPMPRPPAPCRRPTPKRPGREHRRVRRPGAAAQSAPRRCGRGRARAGAGRCPRIHAGRGLWAAAASYADADQARHAGSSPVDRDAVDPREALRHLHHARVRPDAGAPRQARGDLRRALRTRRSTAACAPTTSPAPRPSRRRWSTSPPTRFSPRADPAASAQTKTPSPLIPAQAGIQLSPHRPICLKETGFPRARE